MTLRDDREEMREELDEMKQIIWEEVGLPIAHRVLDVGIWVTDKTWRWLDRRSE